MLEDAAGIQRGLGCGYVALRKDINELASIIGNRCAPNMFGKRAAREFQSGSFETDGMVLNWWLVT